MELEQLKKKLAYEKAVFKRLEQAVYGQGGKVALLEDLIKEIENPQPVKQEDAPKPE